jgi:hypothetical protein
VALILVLVLVRKVRTRTKEQRAVAQPVVEEPGKDAAPPR